MKLEEWREIELILMAQPIHFFHFHQSSLPNGKIDWEMKRNDGQWAPREWMNQWNWWFHSIGCGICLICLALLFLMNGGLWAVAPPMAPPRRENKQTKPNESKKWSWRIEKIVNGAEASNKAKSIYWIWFVAALPPRNERPTKLLSKKRGKPFSNSHFFFFVKKRNGIAEMEELACFIHYIHSLHSLFCLAAP